MPSHFVRTAVRAYPLCFVIGMGMEFFMLRVRVGQETFCALAYCMFFLFFCLFFCLFFFFVFSAENRLLTRLMRTDDVALRKEAERRQEAAEAAAITKASLALAAASTPKDL